MTSTVRARRDRCSGSRELGAAANPGGGTARPAFSHHQDAR